MPISDKVLTSKYYQALLEKDPEFTGVFYAGVKSTMIFCLSICSARKPKRENVEFFTHFKEATQHGYRPCKICKPTQNAFQPPEPVQKALKIIEDYPGEKVQDWRLRENGIQPELVRRWFKKHFGLTFHAYQRMNRINSAYKDLRDGKTATGSAMDNGYESLSGFAYTFKKLVGDSPKKFSSHSPILIDRFVTPLGPMFVCATNQGICLLEFTDRKMLETEFADLQKIFAANILAGENTHIEQVKREIAEYFDGKRRHFSVPLDTPGSEFRRKVWAELCQIPYGETISYAELAKRVGKPDAVRAVGSANGDNRVAIVIPCHRVIGKDGQLTGYAGGLPRKKWLLDFEQGQPSDV